MKIQINSLEILERLLGGDNQLEVDLRGAIVQEFTKRYLKGIVSEELMYKQRSEISKELREMYKMEGHWGNQKVTLDKKITDEIRKQVITAFEATINMQVEELVTLKLAKLKADVTAAFENLSYKISDSITDKKFEERVLTEVNRRLVEAAKK